MLTFLESLLQSGQPLLNPGEDKPVSWIDRQLSTTPPAVTSRLRDLHASQSLDFPGTPLEFDEEAAWFGFRTLFILVSATAFRELEFGEIQGWLQRTNRLLTTPESHFSADLCLHHLPALREIVLKIADGDPLLELIDDLALQAPLSSVSLPLESIPDLAVLNQHPGLAQLHAERVVSRSDSNRATDPSVSDLIHTMVGKHGEQLLPAILHPSS